MLPPALRWAGPLLALGYGIGSRIHRALSTPRQAPLPVICIGNITVGGTGKTPAVKYFARELAARGRKPAVLMRGYKQQASDEAVEVERALADLKVPVIVGADRPAGALRAKEQGCDCALLDDGFQHWRLARDLDIVLVDATDPFGGGNLVPWGRLREWPEALARAGVVIITRADMVASGELASLETEIAGLAPQAVVATACHKATRLRALHDGSIHPLEKLKGMLVSGVCGIGHPESFRRMLEQEGAIIHDFTALDDHHEYDSADRAAFILTPALGNVNVVTTEKDAVKISRDIESDDEGIWCLEVAFEIMTGKDSIWEKVDAALKAGDARNTPA